MSDDPRFGGLIPNDLSFSQRTVGWQVEQYAADMRAGRWDWNRSGPLRVMDVDGKFVSFDNRRLMAARLADLKEVPIQVVDPAAPSHIKGRTWADTFSERLSDPRNVAAGGRVPVGGQSWLPRVIRPRR